MGQLGHQEEEQLYAAAKRAKEHGSSSVPLDRERIIEQVRNVIGELYERESVLKLDKILAEDINYIAYGEHGEGMRWARRLVADAKELRADCIKHSDALKQ